MSQFRKKPVVIDAVQYAGNGNLVERGAVPSWFWKALESGVAFNRDGRLMLKTLEGEHVVSDGDWIIRGVKGELYPCKPDIFALTYEPATPSSGATDELEAILGSRPAHQCAGWDCVNCHERDNAIRNLLNAGATSSGQVSPTDAHDVDEDDVTIEPYNGCPANWRSINGVPCVAIVVDQGDRVQIGIRTSADPNVPVIPVTVSLPKDADPNDSTDVNVAVDGQPWSPLGEDVGALDPFGNLIWRGQRWIPEPSHSAEADRG